MKKITAIAMAAVLIAAFASSAGASERHRGRYVQPSASTADARDAFAYYPGWGRPRCRLTGSIPA